MGCEISGLWIVVGGEAAISHIHHRKIDTQKKKTKKEQKHSFLLLFFIK